MKKTLLSLLFLLLGFALNAQSLSNITTLYADKSLILNVKQYGQFVKRFNYEEDFKGNPINHEFKTKIDRANYILYLFNNKDPRLTDSLYLNQIEEFIGHTVTDSLKINRLSDSTFVLLKCKVTYNNAPQMLYLVLHMEKINKGYRWSLCNAYADFLSFGKKQLTNITVKQEDLKLIPPTSNEVNFMHLRNAFQEKENLTYYASGTKIGEGLLILLDFLKSNRLEFEYVEKLKYYIFDIQGWVVEVSEFIRNTENSGWLISNIEKNGINAADYMNTLLKNTKKNE